MSGVEVNEIIRDLKDATKQFMSGKEAKAFKLRAQNYPKEFPIDFLRMCAPMGFLGMDIPSAYDGSEMSAQMQAAVTEEFCRAHAGLGLSVLVANSLAAFPIAKFGNIEQKQKYLPKMATGEIFGCFAITEPNVGSDAKAIEMKAVRDGAGFRIRGSKRFITNASGADIAVLDARTGPAELREKSITAFIGEIKNVKEVTIPKAYDKIGLHGSVLCMIHFDDLFIPEENILGELNNGFDSVIAGTLAHSRIQIAAQGVGIAQAALDETEAYAQTRKQFGKYLKDIPNWANHFEVLKRQVSIARFLTANAALQEDERNPNFFVWASLAKLIAGETAIRVSEDAMLLHGGDGYVEEMRIGQIVNDALVVRIYEGTAHIQIKILDKFGIGRRKRVLLYPPKNMLDLKLNNLPSLEHLKEKITGWKIKI